MSNSEVYLTREEIEHPYANLAVMLEDKRKKAERIRRTVFARITSSPEVLAPQFIFKQWHAFDGKWGWFSLLLMDGDKLNSPWFESYEEAYAATVAKLNEVAE